MEKFDSKLFEEWCKKHKKDSTDPVTFIDYMSELQEQDNKEKEDADTKEVEKIFYEMAKVVDKEDAKFDKRAVGWLKSMFERIVLTVDIGTEVYDTIEHIAKMTKGE